MDKVTLKPSPLNADGANRAGTAPKVAGRIQRLIEQIRHVWKRRFGQGGNPAAAPDHFAPAKRSEPYVANPGRLDPGIWKIASVATIGAVLSQLDATVVNVSLSSLATNLHTTLASIQWVTSGYLLALALVLPLNGWLVHRIGAKALYQLCFVGFTIASCLCGLAWSGPSLIAARILQGICGGLMAPMAQMMIVRAAGNQMARVMSVAVLPVVMAPMFGPMIAGAILRYASWRWLFLVNLPVGIVALLLATVFLPNEREVSSERPLDLAGLALLSPGLVVFLFGADRFGHPIAWPVLAAAAMLLGAFFWRAKRIGGSSLIDVRLFRNRNFSTSVTTQFLSNGVAFAGQMLVPVYLVRACGRSPSEAGWLLAPLGLGMLIAFPLMGELTERFGTRRVAATGAFLSLAGTVPFLWFARYPGTYAGIHWGLAAALVVRGIGLSSVGIPTIAAAYTGMAPETLPMAVTALNIVQRLGGPTLTTLCAAFLGWWLAGALDPGMVAKAFLAAFALLCALHVCLLAATLWLPWFVDRAPHNIRTPPA